jgi:rRNA-processing protein FCF1
MRLIITDTNVLFDVIKIGALPEFFSLNFNICTTTFVIEEIKPPEQRDIMDELIRSKKLTVLKFSGTEIEEIESFEICNVLKRLPINP